MAENSFTDFLMNPVMTKQADPVLTMLSDAQRSIGGKWPVTAMNYPQVPLDLFATLHPEHQKTYMEGISRLPDPVLSNFFGRHPDTKWTSEMISQHMLPYLDVFRTGMPR